MMRNVKAYLKAISMLIILAIALSALMACNKPEPFSDKDIDNAKKQYGDVAKYEDTGEPAAQSPNVGQPEPVADSAGSNEDVSKPDGLYNWTQTFLESNYSNKAVVSGELAEIVTNADGTGMINATMNFRLSGNELLVDYSLGDPGQSRMTGTLTITVINGKKHIEGELQTKNADGFYTREKWVMDQQ